MMGGLIENPLLEEFCYYFYDSNKVKHQVFTMDLEIEKKHFFIRNMIDFKWTKKVFMESE